MKIAYSINDLSPVMKENIVNMNIFFQEEYADYIHKQGARYLYLCDDCFLIPVAIYRKAGIAYATYLSEYYYFGDITDQDKVAFLDKAGECLKKEFKVSWVTTLASSFFDCYPKKSERIPFGSHVIDLSLSEEEIWNNVHSKHRNSIRKAEKSGVIIVSGGKELIEDYLILDRQTWARSGKCSYGSDFFDKMLNCLGTHIIVYMAYYNEEPQAGAIFYYNSSMSYYMYGTSANHTESGSTNLLHWVAICDMKKKGVIGYSFVGCRIGEDDDSKYHGIQRFKERFGGPLKRGYMFKTVLNKKKAKLFRWLYYVKNKRELTDAIDEEIAKWKDIND